MRTALTAAAGALLATAAIVPAGAQDVEGGLFIINANGARSWSVECDLVTDRGGAVAPEARGRGSRSSGAIVGRDIVSGDCVAQASDRGPLELRHNDEREQFACPFPEAEGSDFCAVAIPAGATYEFSATLRGDAS